MKPDEQNLDEADRQLLAMLRQDSRQPVTKLATDLGLSRANIYARLSRLEQDGIIQGYTVRLGSDYDRRLIRAQVMIKVQLKLAKATEEQLAAIAELSALHAISGEYDLIALIEAETVSELNTLIDRIGALDGVERTTSSILLATKILR
ncbi:MULTISPECIES: Lrp/AsnC family transcriptional regulator [unclassified Caulobacter]|uniref:Lrp/AsnC family transcriptional regulator n=1 Tax=unclassified Caulobacter TaxID=2648921 RepID=UPI000D34F176|nr:MULTISPECIES: Lrp/AsnC family transcriptional regulator [unclassified Caulobacter]PTS87117.1 AsnC family transcriptional regulator [Caulobacter sp. HMWF009]PTT06349.1 AsnC family transcriptional regulator [Caulobacter sp. HMWF025]